MRRPRDASRTSGQSATRLLAALGTVALAGALVGGLCACAGASRPTAPAKPAATIPAAAPGTSALPAPIIDPMGDTKVDQYPFPMEADWTGTMAADKNALEYQVELTPPAGKVVLGPWVKDEYWDFNVARGGKYHWRVRSREAVRPETVSAWSKLDTFTITAYPPGSCPFPFTWNGSGWVFGTDLFDHARLGTAASNGFVAPIPHDAYVLDATPGPRAGAYEIRLVEERQEADYLDEAKLYAVDLPRGNRLFAEEPVAGAPFDLAKALHSAAGLRPPASVRSVNSGAVLTAKVAANDGDLAVLNTDRNVGFTYQTLEIDPGDIASATSAKLVIDMLCAFPDTPAGLAREASFGPRTKLEVQDTAGRWVEVPHSLAVVPKPSEFMRAYVVDISKIWRGPSRKIRLTFLFKTYIDSIGIDTSPDQPIHPVELPVISAELRHHGIDAATAPGEVYEYGYGAPNAEQGFLPGAYTRYGTVAPLISALDDKFVIMGGGDEIALRFKPLPAPAPGRTRLYVLYCDGYYKDANVSAAHTVTPLPFAAMSNFPYPATESYPSDASHQTYQRLWNTRTER